MAGRGPQAEGAGDAAAAGERSGRTVPGPALAQVCDPVGRPRGTGFAADEYGTVVTSHEAVDGLTRIVLHAPDGRTCVVPADAVVALPGAGLALVRTEGLGLRPLPLAVRDSVATGAYVRIAAPGWRQARVLGSSPVTYAAADREHSVGTALELAIGTDGADALRPGGGRRAAGRGRRVRRGPRRPRHGAAAPGPGPPPTGRRARHPPPARLRDPAAGGGRRRSRRALAELIARNAATVPGYGHDLNLAGALHLTATSAGSDGPGEAPLEPVERPEVTREFDAFLDGPAHVLGLVGNPGTGRTTELAALAARRAQGGSPRRRCGCAAPICGARTRPSPTPRSGPSAGRTDHPGGRAGGAGQRGARGRLGRARGTTRTGRGAAAAVAARRARGDAAPARRAPGAWSAARRPGCGTRARALSSPAGRSTGSRRGRTSTGRCSTGRRQGRTPSPASPVAYDSAICPSRRHVRPARGTASRRGRSPRPTRGTR